MVQIKTVLDSENKMFNSVKLFSIQINVLNVLISNDGQVVTDKFWYLSQIEISCICTVDKAVY